jgi:hypothetical protein
MVTALRLLILLYVIHNNKHVYYNYILYFSSRYTACSLSSVLPAVVCSVININVTHVSLSMANCLFRKMDEEQHCQLNILALPI